MKFTKKPVTIEAMQVKFGRATAITQWMGGDSTGFHIKTLEGTMTASPDDYIIKGVKGEFYPCKPDIFRYLD